MLVENRGRNEGCDVQDRYRRELQDKVIKEGMELWKKQKEYERMRKVREQKEMKEMLDNYWPWGKGGEAKPRGLKNLRLEELFPINDYEKAKRFVGTLDLGRGGGGAPMIYSGRKITKTKVDPILRFQFGSKDLRRCVDNTLRYKTTREHQQEYKKQLDKLVEEKRLKEKREKADSKQFHQQQGWSDHDTLRDMEEAARQNKAHDSRTYENFKRMKMVPPNKVRIDAAAGATSHRRNFVPVGKNRKLSPLTDSKDQGVDLVQLLANKRNYPPRIPLSSTDVTADQNITGRSVWNRQGSSYLKELMKQMLYKQQQLKEQKEKEIEFVRQHFSTYDSFWGKPGNGAPLPELKKQCLDRLLYPQMFPVGVH